MHTKVLRRLWIWVGMLLVVLPPVFADETETTLETITVTAERFPVTEKESARFVTVVTSGELKESGANNLVDGLRRRGDQVAVE